MKRLIKPIAIALGITALVWYNHSQGSDAPDLSRKVHEQMLGQNPARGTNWTQILYENNILHHILASRDEKGADSLRIETGNENRLECYTDDNVDGVLDKHELLNNSDIRTNSLGIQEAPYKNAEKAKARDKQQAYELELRKVLELMSKDKEKR